MRQKDGALVSNTASNVIHVAFGRVPQEEAPDANATNDNAAPDRDDEDLGWRYGEDLDEEFESDDDDDGDFVPPHAKARRRGTFMQCPACFYGDRVNANGEFTCENCGFVGRWWEVDSLLREEEAA